MCSRVLTAIAISVVSTTGYADERTDRAAKLFEEGRILAEQKRFGEACAKLEESFALVRATGTKLGLANCHEQQQHLREAHRLFEEAASDFAAANDDRATFARDRANALVPRLGVIVVQIADPATPGLVVTIGGRTVIARGELREYVDPGEVEVAATATGRPRFVERVTAAPGAPITVAIAWQTAPATPAPSTGDTTQRRRGRKTLTYALGGSGVVALAAASWVGLRARTRYRSASESGDCVTIDGQLMCNDRGLDTIDRAETLADTATVIFVGGLVLAAAGVTIYLTAPLERVTIAPAPTTSSLGVVVEGRF